MRSCWDSEGEMKMRRTSWWVKVPGAIACLAVLFAVSCDDGGGGGGGALSELATGAANAGPNQTVVYAATVTLDGSDSHGPGTTAKPQGATPTSYAWTQTVGTPTVTLDTTVPAKPTFDAPSADAALTFELTVNGVYKDTVKIIRKVYKPIAKRKPCGM